METKYIDLHTHTMYSDGIDTPAGLVKAQKLRGLDIIAKTDHDTLRGYEEMKIEAEKWGLTVIPGVEISDKDYHILGLGFDTENQEFRELIEKSEGLQKENTRQRIGVLRVRSFGMPITMEKIETYCPDARLGKGNITYTVFRDKECREFLEAKHGPSFSKDEFMNLYLRKNGIANEIPIDYNLERQEIIDGVHKAGGIAIIAHPTKDVKDLKELDELRERGLDGFEIQPNFYPGDKAINYHQIEEYAKEHNMLLTYGSDYHGAYMDRGLLGRGMNKMSPELEERLFAGVNV